MINKFKKIVTKVVKKKYSGTNLIPLKIYRVKNIEQITTPSTETLQRVRV